MSAPNFRQVLRRIFDSLKEAIRIVEVDKKTISTNNSSATPLVDAGVYTGTGEDVSGFSTITVFVDSDLDGTLSMEFSSDNSNWDRKKVVPVLQAIGSGSVHTLEVVSRYFRIVYINVTGSGTQSHFRLQSIFHAYRSGFLTSSPDEKISKINDAQIIRVSNDPFFDFARSLYADKISIHKFGYNSAVPNGSYADIWSHGPDLAVKPWPTTNETFRVKAGGDANDTSTGTGARTIQIQYLDANGDLQQDQLTLAGANVSTATSVTGRRVQRVWVDTAGTINGNNIGEIIIENSTSNEEVSAIEPGIGQTQATHFTTPARNTAYLIKGNVSVAIGTNKDADVKMWQRRNAYNVTAPFGGKRLIHQWEAIQGANNPLDLAAYIPFPPLTDIWLEGKGNGAATSIDVQYDLVCIEDEAATTPQ